MREQLKASQLAATNTVIGADLLANFNYLTRIEVLAILCIDKTRICFSFFIR